MKLKIIEASSSAEAESKVNEFSAHNQVKNVQIETFFDGRNNMLYVCSIVYVSPKKKFGE